MRFKWVCYRDKKGSENQNQAKNALPKTQFDFKKRMEKRFKSLPYKPQKEKLKMALKAGKNGSLGFYKGAFQEFLGYKIGPLNPNKKETLKSK